MLLLCNLKINTISKKKLQNYKIDAGGEEHDHDDDRENTHEDIQDLCKLIPGLYRLSDLCKDNGSSGLGMKVACFVS